MNRFTILESEEANHDPNERRFLVKSPSGSEHEVLVQLDHEAVGYVGRMRRKLLPENSFWTSQLNVCWATIFGMKEKFRQPGD